ncbi:hypothetical protein TRFO_30621 [Tritrichomonas foetus]|uniref:Uncharacterized protein n=1 Tax=Tritrichomonas foetus TaxID=1144522 RepID=A0A1J4JT46_9EUKA|nr:hypothetical protein TRFO_30621 [Tritrichomonas foetus]|eukprot:OHT02297.1 hypothetical protein TRFO_30621 [Tritrichomonas foetus]
MIQKDPSIQIQWGLETEAIHPIKATSIGTVVQIGSREFMAVTQQKLVRFETSIVSAYLPYQLTALVSIPEHRILVGVTAVSAEFIVIMLSDVKNPIFPGVKANDASVFNILYCPKSKVLITSGENLKTWKFSFIMNKSALIEPPQVKIEYQKTIIQNFQGSIMNPPIVDYDKELVYIDDQSTGSIHMYNLNGDYIGCALRYQSSFKTYFALNQDSKKIITSNPDQGVVLWHKTGSFMNRFLLGNAAALAIRFLNKEFVLILDANNGLTIIDIKTSRSHVCYKADGRVSRIFYFENPIPRVILCCNSCIIILKVVLPWKFWTSTISRPISMIRCPKFNEAARLLVMCSDSHFKLISPSTKSTLTAITLQSLAPPIAYFYDRGSSEIKRDQVMLPLQDGTIQIFSTGENPCKLVSSFEAKCICISQCIYRQKQCFVFGTNAGNLLFFCYHSLTQIHRIVLLPYRIIKIFSYNDYLCLVYDDQLIKFSLKEEKLCENLKIAGSEVSLFFNNKIIFGYENGEIGCATFDQNMNLVEHYTNGLKIHDDKITGLSSGSNYFVSCSSDMSVRIWSNEFTLIAKIVLPLPLISIAVLNGKRDIVVGTETEIMLIPGEIVFKGVIDEENVNYDNYDKLSDYLEAQFAQLVLGESDNNEESLLGARKPIENEESPKSKPKRAKFSKFAEALKKHQEMMAQQAAIISQKIATTADTNKLEDDEDREKAFLAMNNLTNGNNKNINDEKKIKEMLNKDRMENQKRLREKGENPPEEEETEVEYEYEYEIVEEESEAEDLIVNEESKNHLPIENTKSEIKKETKPKLEEPPIIIKKEIPKANASNSSPKTQNNSKTKSNDDDDIIPPTMKNKSARPSRKVTSPRKHQLNFTSDSSTTKISNSTNDGNMTNSNEKMNKSNDLNGNEVSYSYSNDSDYSDLENVDEMSLHTYIESENQTEGYENIRKLGESSNHHKNRYHHHLNSDENKNNDQSHHHHHRRHSNDLPETEKNLSISKDNQNKPKISIPSHSKNKSNLSPRNINRNINLKFDTKKTKLKNRSTSPNSKFKESETLEKNKAIKPKLNSRVSRFVDHKVRANLLLVNDRLLCLSKPKTPMKQTSQVSNEKKPIIQLTRRYPTPLAYRNLKPMASLFERSLKQRERPKTPSKENGLIISRGVVPTNIVFDATVLDSLFASNDERYQPLLKQLKPILRSQHAFFNLRVILPSTKRPQRINYGMLTENNHLVPQKSQSGIDYRRTISPNHFKGHIKGQPIDHLYSQNNEKEKGRFSQTNNPLNFVGSIVIGNSSKSDPNHDKNQNNDHHILNDDHNLYDSCNFEYENKALTFHPKMTSVPPLTIEKVSRMEFPQKNNVFPNEDSITINEPSLRNLVNHSARPSLPRDQQKINRSYNYQDYLENAKVKPLLFVPITSQRKVSCPQRSLKLTDASSPKRYASFFSSRQAGAVSSKNSLYIIGQAVTKRHPSPPIRSLPPMDSFPEAK